MINSKDKKSKKKSYQQLAYGEMETGNLNLAEVPSNLAKEQDKEHEVIKKFWDREYEKCVYVAERKQ